MADVYVPPYQASSTASGIAPTSGSTGSSGTNTDGSRRADQVAYFVRYLDAHQLSVPSHRYIYVLWIVLVGVLLLVSALHHAGIGDRSYLGAAWNKFAVKHRVIKLGKRQERRLADGLAPVTAAGTGGYSYPPKSAAQLRPQQPPKRKVFTFPSIARMLALFVFIAVPICLTLIGADYISPTVSMFNVTASFPTDASIASSGIMQKRSVQFGLGSYPTVTTNVPQYTLPYRDWWTAGDRTGEIANALTPLVVIFALKQVPFAVLSLQLFGGYAFDRLSFLHKWGGRIVWLFAAVHVGTWSVQLKIDKRYTGSLWQVAFTQPRFRWGFVAFIFLTLLVALSIAPMRNRYYEIFYVLHVIMAIGFMVAAWIHHPPLGPWLYAALAWWACERITRWLKVSWVNGLGFAGRKPQFIVSSSPSQGDFGHRSEKNFSSYGSSRGDGSYKTRSLLSPSSSSHEGSRMGYAQPQPFENGYQTPHPPQGLPAGQHWLNTDPHPDQEDDGFGGRVVKKRPSTKYSARYDPVSDVIKDYLRTSQYDTPTLHPPSATPKYQLEDPGVASSEAPPEEMPGNTRNRSNSNKSGRPTTASSNGSSHAYNTRAITFDPSVPTMKPRPAMAADVAALIRPGWAFVQLLPGKTLRLTLRTPNRVSWRPGQWVNVNIPGVRWWESHPFTIASAHDAEFPTATQFGDGDEELGVKQDRVKGEERTMVLLLRARKGFTKQLWEHVRRKRQLQVKAAIQADSASAVNGPNFAAIGKSTTGVHMRAIVDGPYGSVGRVKWGAHSTIVIICGGSGVSFGMSVLEHLCACIAGAAALGRAGKGGRGFHTQRVRFVWIMREFAHLQWVASALRRCIEMVPPEQLQVDLFVTHFHDQVALAHTAGARSQNLDELSPPSAPFRRPQHVARNSWNSAFSRDSVADYNSLGTQDVGVLAPAVPSPRNLRFTEGSEQEEFDIREYDLTHFDGEDQSAPTAAEMEISSRVRKEGKLRRAHTRKMTMKRKRGGPGHGESAALASQRAIHDAVSKPEPALPSVGEQQYDSDSGSSFSGERSRPRRNVVGSRSPLNPAIPLSSPDPNEHGYESEKDLGYSFPPDSPRANGPGFGSNTPESRRSFEGSGEHLAPPGPARSAGHAGGSMPVSPFSSASAWGWPSSSRGHDADLEARSADGHSLMPPSGLSTRRQSTVGLLSSVEAVEKAADVDDEPIDLDEGENADLQVLAELARPGHPKLDRIIREEVNQAQGCILVGACGPASLGTVLRSIVSKQIDPSKVWNGDLTGQINIVTEAYEWGS